MPLGTTQRRTIPWGLIWDIAVAVRDSAKERLTRNLSRREQADFRRLLGKSKGRRANLTDREQTRLIRLLKKAVTADPDATWFQVVKDLPALVPADAIPNAWKHLQERS